MILAAHHGAEPFDAHGATGRVFLEIKITVRRPVIVVVLLLKLKPHMKPLKLRDNKWVIVSDPISVPSDVLGKVRYMVASRCRKHTNFQH